MQHPESPPRGSPVAIGIDLGTSKCCVAAVRDGRAHVLLNEFGQRTTPSWVAFNSQQRLVGGAALDQAVVNCANTVSGVKRTLGRTYDDVKGLPSTCIIKKCNINSNFEYRVNYRKRQLQLSSEQITAMMLTKMKDIAETSLGRPVKQAVISVPACYGNIQRTAIMNAAKVAGLEVLQLINETTAAGIVFEDNRSVKTPVTIAVVDFGAGKLDVSVMEVERKSIKVIGASGSPYLGGCNVDELLVDHCVGIIQQKYKREEKISKKGRVKLRLACEKAKKTLSLLPEAQVSIESLFEDCDVQIQVHRQKICDLIEDEIRSTIFNNFERIFEEKSMGKEVIEKVVLVGGSTRIPVVKTILEEYFGSHKLDQTVNQDEAVAQGAALQAAALSRAAAGIEVADVSSFDVYFSGSSRNKNKFNKIINKFSPVPSIRSLKLNELRGTDVRFFECMYCFNGCKCDTDHLKLEFIGSIPSFDCDVVLTLHLDKSGMFLVSLQSPTDKYKPKYVPAASHLFEINNWARDEEKFRCEAKTELKRIDAEVELESLCYDIQSLLSELELAEGISPHELDTSRTAVSNAIDWMTNNIEAASLYDIQQKINKVNNVKKDVHRMMNTARKKAIKKEDAAKKQAEMELLNKEILSFGSLLSEVMCALQDSNLVMDFYPEILEECKDKTTSLMTFEENIDSASLTEVSQKLEDLTRVKTELDQLKADAAHEKTRIGAENEAARKREENELLKTQISEFESLLSDVRCTMHDTIFVMYSNQQIFKVCESKLNDLLAWRGDSETASITLVSQKLEKLKQLKHEVDQMKTDALEEARVKEAMEKQEEVELHQERICTFKSLLCEVEEMLRDLHPASSSYSSKLWLCKESFRGLKAWKEIIEASSETEVSKKLEELTQLKREVDQLKKDVERHKSQETKEVADEILARDSPEQQTCSYNSSNSSSANKKMIRNVALSSILDNKERIKSEHSSISCNSSGGSVESPLVLSVSNHDHTERGRSKSVNRPATEGEGHRSRKGPRAPSVDVTSELGSRLESGQSLERFQPSDYLKNGQPSLSRSQQNSIDDLAKRNAISCNVLGGQNGEPRSSSQSRQSFGNEDKDRRTRTSLNSEEKNGEQRRSTRERSSRSRQPSENKDVKHRYQTPHNSEEKEGEQKVFDQKRSSSRPRQPSERKHVEHRSPTPHYSDEKEVEQKVPHPERSSSRSRQPSQQQHVVHRSRTPHNSAEKEGEHKVSNRERSTSRPRHGSAISKERRLAGLCSSLEGEHHHQPKASCEGTASEGPHLHQRRSSDECTEQPTSARGAGSSLDQMRKSAVLNRITLPKKPTPWRGLAPSKGYDSTVTCESNETQTETSARTKTVVASSEKSCSFGNKASSGNDVKEYWEKEEKLVKKFKDAGILLPILEILENTSRNIADCEKCLGFNFICHSHHDESFDEFGKFLTSFSQISLTQKLGERKTRLQSENSVEFAVDVLSTDISSAPNVNDLKERESSNDVANSYAEFSVIVPCQNDDIPDGRTSVMRSLPEGSTRPVFYNSVYLTQSRASTDVRENCVSGPSQWHLSGNKVRSLKTKFESSGSL